MAGFLDNLRSKREREKKLERDLGRISQTDQAYAQSLLNAKRNAIPSAFRGQEQGLETPMFSPDDLIGTGLITKGATLAAAGLAPLAAMAGLSSLAAKRGVTTIPNRLAQMMPNQAGAIAKQTKTQFELAHELAQRNAALPIEQGGLGLPPNNTAMDRAKAMGFVTAPSKTQYHGSRFNFEGEVDPSKSDFGFHTGTLEQADARLKAFGGRDMEYPEGANIMPLMVDKYANLLKVADEGSFHANSLAPQLAKKGLMDKKKAKLIQQEIEKDWKLQEVYDPVMRNVVEQSGYQGIKYPNAQEGSGLSYAYSDPSVLRSRFAAFDPMQRKSANLLAGGAAGALGLNTLSGIYKDEYQ